MSSRSPYEVRLEVLKMAKDLVETEFHTNRGTTKREISDKEIIDRAKTLYGFVSDNSSATTQASSTAPLRSNSGDTTSKKKK